MISIILPIRNEFIFIKKTLQSILSQVVGDKIEILIADGMSTDETRKIIKDYQDNHANIHLIDNPERIVSTGFNRALSVAKGDIIIRVDGHSEIDQSFIQNCINTIKRVDTDCVGGSTNHIANGIIGHSIVMAQSSYFGVGGVAFRKKNEKGQFVDTLAFGAYKRDVFNKMGGYDEELVRNQDDEFNFRLIQNGGKIWLDPSIKSTYYPRNTLATLFKQYFQYGFYKIRVMQKRKGFASWRHLVPGIFVMLLILGTLFLVLKGNPTGLMWVLIPYLSVSFLFTLRELFKMSKSFISIFLLPITFFILHFSYGIGFLFGIGYFIKKWNNTELIDSHFNRELFNANTLS